MEMVQISEIGYMLKITAALFLKLCKVEKLKTYNIGGNNEYTNSFIVNKICDLLDEIKPIKKESKNSSYKELIVNTKDRLGHDFRYSINSSKLIETLNWSPSIDFDDGIRDTINWYLANQDWVESIYKKQ